MVEQQARDTRYIRAFGLFTLLAGIVAMHAVVFGMSHAESGHSGGSHAAVTVAAVPQEHAAMPQEHAATTMPGCGGDCDSGHAGMHGCLFVLAALLLGLGLALLGWVGLRDRETTTARVRRPRAHRARPPPWTVLTLADLAILRI
ncbi:DUF6153 family protein [Nocardia yamanashiensis]|uniref:DUF6153 family protein n=1 Tax=Nocardia yamanashiensis TaxID=209247 RepID=UPI001E3AD2F0|nr:DUF6153 family protein [Nocardia yamanashiensis]UGT38793.1 DUF6153 family protein [Nocardia yamanashiensis]